MRQEARLQTLQVASQIRFLRNHRCARLESFAEYGELLRRLERVFRTQKRQLLFARFAAQRIVAAEPDVVDAHLGLPQPAELVGIGAIDSRRRLDRTVHDSGNLVEGRQVKPFRRVHAEAAQIDLLLLRPRNKDLPILFQQRGDRFAVIAAQELVDQLLGVQVRLPHHAHQQPILQLAEVVAFAFFKQADGRRA